MARIKNTHTTDRRPADEMSDVEVQNALDAERVGPPVVHDAVDAVPATKSALELHALDSAKVNSKIVVTRDAAVLATPDGLIELPVGDPARKLREGARIQKMAEGVFVATQLNATEICPDKTYPTAAQAIEDFPHHFHHVKRGESR